MTSVTTLAQLFLIQSHLNVCDFMPEDVLGIPLKILFVLIVVLVALVFTVSYLLFSKDSAERIISIIAGVFSSFAR